MCYSCFFFGMLLLVSSKRLLLIWMNEDFSYPSISLLFQSVVQITFMKSSICKLRYSCLYMYLHIYIYTHMCVMYIHIYIFYYYTLICKCKEALEYIFQINAYLYMSEKVWAKLTAAYLLACIHCTLLLVFN